MDLNQLLFQHQVAVMNASSARSRDDRLTYFDLVDHYAKRIRECRDIAGLPRHYWLTGSAASEGGEPSPFHAPFHA